MSLGPTFNKKKPSEKNYETTQKIRCYHLQQVQTTKNNRNKTENNEMHALWKNH